FFSLSAYYAPTAYCLLPTAFGFRFPLWSLAVLVMDCCDTFLHGLLALGMGLGVKIRELLLFRRIAARSNSSKRQLFRAQSFALGDIIFCCSKDISASSQKKRGKQKC